jgi:hypothetical protein
VRDDRQEGDYLSNEGERGREEVLEVTMIQPPIERRSTQSLAMLLVEGWMSDVAVLDSPN